MRRLPARRWRAPAPAELPPISSSFAFQRFPEDVEQVNASVYFVAVDGYALDVDAERDGAAVGAVEDAAQVVAADLDRLGERAGGAQDRALGLRRHVYPQPAQESERLLPAAGREGEDHAPRVGAGAAAVAQVVAQQPLRRRRVV